MRTHFFLSTRARQRPLAWALLALGLSACASGPDFKSPAPLAGAANGGYTAAALPAQTASAPGVGGAAQSLQLGASVPAQWWTVFQSPELDALIRRALQNSPNVAAAKAALQQAQALYQAQSGALEYPSVNAQLGVQRERASALSTGVPNGTLLSLYNASVNVAYTVDLNGASQRSLEAQQAVTDYQRFQLEATYLSLSANVVTTAIRDASLRGQLRATQELLKTQQEQLVLLEQQQLLGGIGLAPVLQQRNAVAQTRASVAPLEKALEQTRHLLAVLVGEVPGQAPLPQFELEGLHLPTQLPLTVPSELARQRPDVRAVEEQMHQASAALGVATANLYPQLTLSASMGSATLKPEKLFTHGWSFWSLAGGLVEPLFNGGALQAKERAARASLEVASQQYRSTLLLAFQNVADSLRALDSDANALAYWAASESALAQARQLAQSQYQLGSLSYLAYLDAQRSHQQVLANLVAARAARYADTAALFQALGGGWSQASPTPMAQATPPQTH